ncbi:MULTISPECIES: hypothetical protein [unclassified Bosea (in: a-proteobacteria)]|jgi:hypothetical protein|uniref:hypothetical protein n=1 Tax=unclassified Bosea (in: a-proteobacteria) TaxID=2653178 RepID=UPI00095553DB|nr:MULTISPECIES: hypothetical protein [unclassified Bosea (in: a-proteobacteria)]TAJ29691.1 MAG: hypothetical protein EPO59_13995 [Bosea sp. (in: a-proteobacteria)]SIQ57494.1 hypothetical protein SAMN05880592_10414 [Bosea sp. TND4EK4]
MTTFRKTLTATLAAATLATTVFASAAEARPRWGYRYGGWGVGAGVVGALAAGAIIAGATRPAYAYDPGPVRSCDLVERFDRWGNVIGYRRVCGYY